MAFVGKCLAGLGNAISSVYLSAVPNFNLEGYNFSQEIHVLYCQHEVHGESDSLSKRNI